MPGYELAENGITSHPVTVVGGNEDDDGYSFWNTDVDKEYPGADADGIHRQALERGWTVRYVPTVAASSGNFTLPTLQSGLDGELTSRTYSDMDLVAVEDGVVPLSEGLRAWTWILVGIVAVVGLVGVVALLGRRRESEDRPDEMDRLMPARSTPLGAVAALERIDREFGDRLPADRRAQLQSQIRELHDRFFGRTGETPNGQLRQLVEQWAREALAA